MRFYQWNTIGTGDIYIYTQNVFPTNGRFSRAQLLHPQYLRVLFLQKLHLYRKVFTTPPLKFEHEKNNQVPQTLLYPIFLVSRKQIAQKKPTPTRITRRKIDPKIHRGLGFRDLWNFNSWNVSWKGGVTAITCDKDLGNLTVSCQEMGRCCEKDS